MLIYWIDLSVSFQLRTSQSYRNVRVEAVPAGIVRITMHANRSELVKLFVWCEFAPADAYRFRLDALLHWQFHQWLQRDYSCCRRRWFRYGAEIVAENAIPNRLRDEANERRSRQCHYDSRRNVPVQRRFRFWQTKHNQTHRRTCTHNDCTPFVSAARRDLLDSSEIVWSVFIMLTTKC